MKGPHLATTSTIFSLLCTCAAFVVTAPHHQQSRQPSSSFQTTTTRGHSSGCCHRQLYAVPPALTIENLSCSHDGETWQLDGVSYVLPRGAKVGLVGRNGSGKSTLLKILAASATTRQSTTTTTTKNDEEEFVYTGHVTTPRNVRVAYVEQEPAYNLNVTVADALLGLDNEDADVTGRRRRQQDTKRNVLEAVRRYQWAVQHAQDNPQAFADASMEMDLQNGWDLWTRASTIATKLRVWHLNDQLLETLSGGELKRVALAAALVQEPDVLLLDEPSNFLSLAGVRWLTDLLVEDKKLTVIMVTHDRIFLDDVCDRILELDNGKLYEYTGKYADYLEGKKERLALEDAAAQAAKAKYRVELEWMRRQPQARESKSKARIDAFYKLEKATRPRPRDPSLTLDSDGQRRMGGKILSMRNVNLAFGDRIMLKDFSYDFLKGDRICLVGANGVGKTTFVRILTGKQPPDSGEIIVGDTIVLGVYDQLGIQIDDPEQTVLNFVLERVQSRGNSVMAEAPDEARRLLRRFEFPRKRWNERLSVLSGGERRRLQMLSVFSQRPNFLVMDEPSVDCDLDTLQALETYLREFDGVLIIVSHDRAFADKVTDHLFVFEGDGEIKDFAGSLSEYATTLVELENESITANGDADESSVEKRASYKEDKAKRNAQRNTARKAKRDMEKLETAIDKLKEKAATIQQEIDSSNDEGWSVLADLTNQLNAINTEIDEKEMQWIEAAELVEELQVEL